MANNIKNTDKTEKYLRQILGYTNSFTDLTQIIGRGQSGYVRCHFALIKEGSDEHYRKETSMFFVGQTSDCLFSPKKGNYIVIKRFNIHFNIGFDVDTMNNYVPTIDGKPDYSQCVSYIKDLDIEKFVKDYSTSIEISKIPRTAIVKITMDKKHHHLNNNDVNTIERNEKFIVGIDHRINQHNTIQEKITNVEKKILTELNKLYAEKFELEREYSNFLSVIGGSFEKMLEKKNKLMDLNLQKELEKQLLKEKEEKENQEQLEKEKSLAKETNIPNADTIAVATIDPNGKLSYIVMTREELAKKFMTAPGMNLNTQ